MRTIEDIIEEQNKQRGFTVDSPIDKELFLKRIAEGGWSGYFLGECFCSMYRTGVVPKLDLMSVCNLDAQAKNFLFKTVFARDVEGWSCEYLYSIEQGVKEILGMKYEEDGSISYPEGIRRPTA